MQEKRTESPMTKVARFIVDKRKAFYLVFIAAFVFCAASINKVQVNNDITSYLPAQTETRRGLTIMDEEFITLGSANVMVSNVTYQTALDISAKDRDGLTLDVAMTLSAAKVKTTSLSARSMPDGYATVSIVLEVKNQEELTNVINKLGQIQGVYQVKRASG